MVRQQGALPKAGRFHVAAASAGDAARSTYPADAGPVVDGRRRRLACFIRRTPPDSAADVSLRTPALLDRRAPHDVQSHRAPLVKNADIAWWFYALGALGD
jgi:hypothetical protein